jgi:alpha-2-macroglobulin
MTMKYSEFTPRKAIGFYRVLAVIMVTSLLAGCQLPWRPFLEEVTEDTKQAKIEETETPTPEPRQDLPPAVVEVSPLPDTVIDLNQPISLFFNQPMDKNSVEAAIHFQPGISGRFSWEGENNLTFTPDQPLAAGSELRLALDTTAQAANKLNLREPYEAVFSTVEPLEILQVFPSDEAQDVDPQSAVFVAFNQPVVSLGAESSGPPAFSLSPEVAGEGEWLNTSTYLFTPDPTMNGGTDYAIQINETLKGVSGAVLDADQDILSSSFTTTNPQVLSISPGEGERLGLDGPVTVEFNIVMDPESVEANFDLLSPGGVSINGNFEWDESYKTFSFTPDGLLDRSTVYTVRLSAGAESFGGLPIPTGVETNRTTHPAFSVDPRTVPVFNAYYSQFGNYQIYFSNPIDPENYKNAVQVTPEVSAKSVYLSEGNSALNVSGYFQPETEYTIVLEEDLQDLWGGKLGEEVSYTFSTPPAESALQLVTGPTSSNLVFVPASNSEVILQATNINTLTTEISPISIEDLTTLLHPENYDYRQVFLPETLEMSVVNLNLRGNINEIVRLPLTFEGEPLEPGVYYLGITSEDISDEFGQKYQKYYLVVSENNLVMKIGPNQALVWATRLDDRSPAAGIPLNLYNTEGEQLASGVTDSDGLFASDISRSGVSYPNFFTVMGEPGREDFGFSISTWGQSSAYYETGIQQDTSPRLHEAYLYTDRPIYRPGDTIHFKAVVYKRENGLPAAPGFETVDVTLTSDPGMAGMPSTLFAETLTLDRFNTVSGSIQLSEDAPTGFYNLKVEVDESLLEILYFNVEEYRKPEIEIGLDFESPTVLVEETLNATVQADYYFGMPAGGQTFSWTVYRDDAHFILPGYRVGPTGTDWLEPHFPMFSPLGRAIDSSQGQTDAQGRADLHFSPEDLALDEFPEGSTHEVNLEVTLQDESGFPVSFRDSVLVHPESFYIGVQPETYFGQVNTAFSFSLLTVDWDQAPVSGVPIEADFETIRWEVEETMNPERPYRYMPQTDLVGSASPVTDEEGKARISFTPEEPGAYQLSLQSGDAVTQVILWVAGESAAIWPRQNQNQIQLVPDAESYQPGQIAQVFIPNPFAEEGRALVTVERGELMHTELLDLVGSGHTLSLTIDEESIPNVYLSVVLLGQDDAGRPDYRQGILNLPVPPITKTLNVALTLDPLNTQPGEEVSAELEVRNVQGDPVQGEFSVAVVDKSLLALVGPVSQPILDVLYGEQPLSIQTSYSLKTYAHQLALTNMELGLGGGGGDAGLSTIREDFPDTAFWRAEVTTGADGTARLSIPMPDSLTTWVVTVRGLTEDYLVGETEAEIITQKDLMIRPVTPRFLVDGDRVEMAAVVHNNTPESLEVSVSLQGVGFTLEEESSQSQRLNLSPGGQARVAWWGTVESVDQVDLTFRASSGGLLDATKPEWGALPVLHYVAPLTFSTSGQLSEEGERLELVSLPLKAVPDKGSLSVAMLPSLTAILVEGIEVVETGHSFDNLSILSRLLENLNAALALREWGVETSGLEANLINQVEKDIRSLLEAQHIEGGWSWRRGSDTPDPFITAYVFLGLDMASQAGLDVSEHFLELSLQYLESRLVSPGEVSTSRDLDRLAFQVYALREQDINLNEYIEGLYARRSELSPWAVGLLGLTAKDRQVVGTRLSVLINDLESQAIRSATGVHWEGVGGSWVLPGSPIFNTSVVVFTLAQLDPASTSLTPALRYLLAHQENNGSWGSPFDSAWAMLAVIKVLQGTGDSQADFEFQALLNDLEIAQGSAASALPAGSVNAEVPVETLYPDSPNALVIQRSGGTGTLYYRVDLRTYLSAQDAEPINQGVMVQREYYPEGENCPGGEGCEPIQSLTLDPEDPTQTIIVALTVTLPHDMYHFLLEDRIPSGTEVLDRDLKTSALGEEVPVPQYDPRSPFSGGWGWWWFDEPQIYDDRLLWTADYLPAGTYTVTYQLLPLQRGAYQVLPASAWQYFFPEVMGASAGDLFEIK